MVKAISRPVLPPVHQYHSVKPASARRVDVIDFSVLMQNTNAQRWSSVRLNCVCAYT